MTQNEKDALIRYLDFQLKQYVEKFQHHVAAEVTNAMYTEALSVLVDINNTLTIDMALKGKSRTS